MADSEVYFRDTNSAFLVHPDYQAVVSSDWFDPDYWGDHARPVGSGGRGSAWFIEAAGRSLVLRQYRRGGLMARLSQASYAYKNEHNVRSFAEFRLLNRLTELGLPVPRPVAAFYRRIFPLKYRAAIIVERIEASTPLAELIDTLDASAWYRLGEVLREFHDAGVHHADLNCYNILVRDGEFFLIDFDKGVVERQNGPSAWKQQSLARLHRSLQKVASDSTVNLQGCWQQLLKGYGTGELD